MSEAVDHTPREKTDVSGLEATARAEGVVAVMGFVERVAGSSCDSLRTWCDWCCIWHLHGLPRDRPIKRQVRRIAHCQLEDSPYRAKAALITVSDVPFEKVCRLVKERTPRQDLMMRQGRMSKAITRLREQRIEPLLPS